MKVIIWECKHYISVIQTQSSYEPQDGERISWCLQRTSKPHCWINRSGRHSPSCPGLIRILPTLSVSFNSTPKPHEPETHLWVNIDRIEKSSKNYVHQMFLFKPMQLLSFKIKNQDLHIQNWSPASVNLVWKSDWFLLSTPIYSEVHFTWQLFVMKICEVSVSSELCVIFRLSPGAFSLFPSVILPLNNSWSPATSIWGTSHSYYTLIF